MGVPAVRAAGELGSPAAMQAARLKLVTAAEMLAARQELVTAAVTQVEMPAATAGAVKAVEMPVATQVAMGAPAKPLVMAQETAPGWPQAKQGRRPSVLLPAARRQAHSAGGRLRGRPARR